MSQQIWSVILEQRKGVKAYAPETWTRAKQRTRNLCAMHNCAYSLDTNSRFFRVHAAQTGFDRLLECLRVIILNAKLIRDSSMDGATDIYSVPIDDIESAQKLLRELSI